ncbi:MAG: thiamine pyrophosphate-binding protein [Chloroflexi bacterium]|nr:thiamine pyrophosphate-binding protein [Chloroflexota bacterium]
MIEATDVFEVFEKHRGDAIVLAGGLSGYKHWHEYSTNQKRDVGNFVGTMGAIAPAALGVALAQPDEKVVLFDSEGSLLMNLGLLATTADQAPRNFYHFLLDNESYATTGGQPVPSAKTIDYAGLAKDAGYVAAYSFDDLEDFASSLKEILDQEGPVFVALKIVPEIENVPIGLRESAPTRSTAEVIRDLREELGIGES